MLDTHKHNSLYKSKCDKNSCSRARADKHTSYNIICTEQWPHSPHCQMLRASSALTWPLPSSRMLVMRCSEWSAPRPLCSPTLSAPPSRPKSSRTGLLLVFEFAFGLVSAPFLGIDATNSADGAAWPQMRRFDGGTIKASTDAAPNRTRLTPTAAAAAAAIR